MKNWKPAIKNHKTAIRIGYRLPKSINSYQKAQTLSKIKTFMWETTTKHNKSKITKGLKKVQTSQSITCSSSLLSTSMAWPSSRRQISLEPDARSCCRMLGRAACNGWWVWRWKVATEKHNKQEERTESQNSFQKKKKMAITGIDAVTSRLLNGRSTTWAHARFRTKTQNSIQKGWEKSK